MNTRPRTASVDLGHCAVHGEIEAANYSHGEGRDGRPRISWTCRECHTVYNTAYRHRQHTELPSGAIGFCNHNPDHGNVKGCRRPFGHPPDFHIDTLGTLYPVKETP